MGLKHITWNPNDKGSLVVLSNSNMTATTTGSNSSVRATDGVTEGKWYWENTVNANNGAHIGIMSERLSTSANNITSVDAMFYVSSGVRYNGASSSYGATYTTNDTIGVALDLDSGTITFYKNGISQGIAFTTVKNLGKVFPFMCGSNGNPTVITTNFGNEPFKYSVPDGYKAYAEQYIDKVLFSNNNGEISSITNGTLKTVKATPNMTSNTTPSGIVSSSSIVGTGSEAWRAFDGKDNQGLVSSGTVGYLQYEFPNEVQIGKYIIRSGTSTGAQLTSIPKNWTFEGSNDSTNWTVLDTQLNQTWATTLTEKEYVIKDPKYFKMYRLNWTANNGGTTYTNINEFKMFDMTPSKTNQIPFVSKNNYIQYGNQSIIDRLNSEFRGKNYILQDIVSENEQGLWTAKIDRKPLSISFN